MQIRARPRAGKTAGLTLSVLFAACMVGLATADLWGPSSLTPDGRVTRFAVRLPETGIYRDLVGPPTVDYRRMVFGPGDHVDAKRDLPLIQAFERGRRPPEIGLLLGLGIAYFLVGMLFCAYLRGFGHPVPPVVPRPRRRARPRPARRPSRPRRPPRSPSRAPPSAPRRRAAAWPPSTTRTSAG